MRAPDTPVEGNYSKVFLRPAVGQLTLVHFSALNKSTFWGMSRVVSVTKLQHKTAEVELISGGLV